MAALDQADSTFSAQVAAKAKAVRDAVAAKAAGRPAGLGEGLLTPPGTGQFQQAQAATTAARGQTLQVPRTAITPQEAASFNSQSQGRFNATQPLPAQPTAAPAEAGSVPQFRILPHETAAFNNQSGGAFSATHPAAPTLGDVRAGGNAAVARPGTLPTGTGAGPNIAEQRAGAASLGEGLVQPAPVAQPSLATRAGAAVRDTTNAIGQVARGGAAPVETVPGRLAPRTAPGQRGATGAALATIGIASAADSIGRPTSDYETRLGVNPVAPGTSAGGEFAHDLGVRTLGVGSDLGATILDAGTGLFNAGRKLAGQEPISTFASHFADQDGTSAPPVTNPAAATAAPGAAPAAAKPGISSGIHIIDPGNPASLTDPANRPSNRQDDPARQQRAAANDGITPVGDRVGDPNEVLGTFNGRKITRADSAQLSSQLNGPVPAAGIGAGLAAPSAASSAPAALGGGVSADLGGSGSEDRLRELTNPNSAAGKLYAQLSEDKTPTGKRMASALLEQFLGTGTTELGQRRSLSGELAGDNTSIQNTKTGTDSAQEVARIGASAARKSQPHYVFNADGSVSQLSDGVLSDVMGTDGKPAKGKPGKASADDMDKQEEYIQRRLAGNDPNHTWTPEQAKAERQAIIDEINGVDPKKAANGAN